MKLIGRSVVILILARSTFAADPDPDQLGKEWVALMTEMRDTFKGIKDKESATAALPKLKELAERFKKVESASDGLTKEQGAALEKKYGATGKSLRNEFEKEINRVEALPTAYPVVRTTVILFMRKAKEDLARDQVKTLTERVEVYFLKHEEFPPNLAALAEKQPDGGKALIPASDLKDPWGRPYEYDVKGPKNGGELPDIWSRGHPGEKETPIGNWPSDKKKPEK